MTPGRIIVKTLLGFLATVLLLFAWFVYPNLELFKYLEFYSR